MAAAMPWAAAMSWVAANPLATMSSDDPMLFADPMVDEDPMTAFDAKGGADPVSGGEHMRGGDPIGALLQPEPCWVTSDPRTEALRRFLDAPSVSFAIRKRSPGLMLTSPYEEHKHPALDLVDQVRAT